MLLNLEVSGYKAIVSLVVEPNGHSFTLTGENGAGKTTAVEAIFKALGGTVDGEIVHEGSEAAIVKMTVDDAGNQIAIRWRQKKGGKPSLVVEDVKDGRPYKSPTALLERFRAGIVRNSFSSLSEAKRVEMVKRMAPGLDVSDITTARDREYLARTAIGSEGEMLVAQAAGVVIPDAPAEAGDEVPIVDVVDVAEIAGKRGDVERQIAKNNADRAQARQVADESRRAAEASARKDRDVEACKATLARLESEAAALRVHSDNLADEAARIEFEVASLVDPDTTAIDREIADARQRNAQARSEAEAHNREVRQRAALIAERKRAEAQRDALTRKADEKRAAYKAATERIRALDEQKAARIAAAKCPVEGLALTADGVTYPGKNGPVPVSELSTGERITLDVLVARALGLRMIPVPMWGEVDRAHRTAINALADAEPRVQLIRELTTETGEIRAIIDEGPAVTEPTA